VNVATRLLDVAGRHDTGEALVAGPVRLDYAAVVRPAGAVSAFVQSDDDPLNWKCGTTTRGELRAALESKPAS